MLLLLMYNEINEYFNCFARNLLSCIAIKGGQSQFREFKCIKLINMGIAYLQALYHWRSSHYAVTHVRNKNSNIQGRSPNVATVISCHKELLLKVRIRSLWVC